MGSTVCGGVCKRHALLLVPLAVYLALVMPLVPEHGSSYDERIDMRIAHSYTIGDGAWLRGMDLDSINVRLPMYLTGVLKDLFTVNEICFSRYLSCLFGLFTLIAVYVFCVRELLDRRKALLACLLLAASPYFLAFSKVAMTEGDIFISCFTMWLLVCIAALRRSSSLGWTVASGVCLGLALSSKISAVALIPAVALALLWRHDRDPGRPAPNHIPVVQLVMLPVAATAILSGWIYAAADDLAALPAAYAAQKDGVLEWHWALVFVSWSVILVNAFRQRSRLIQRWLQLLLLGGVAGVTFFTLPPVHVTNPAIISAIFEQFLDSNTSFSWAFALEALTFHFLVTLIKPSPLIGAGLWLALFVALTQWRARPQLRVLILAFVCYFLFITMKMTWSQTYYMMALFPIMAILLADQLVELFDRRKGVALVAGGVGAGVLAFELARSYPDVHLNGYQWVGERYLAGRSTVGYRSIVQTPSDGVEQVMRWAMENVPVGDRVVYYTHARHIMFTIFDYPMFVANDGLRPYIDLDQGNYVLTAINTDIDHGWGTANPSGSIYKYPYDIETLKREFRKVYSVRRRFGIEMAAVWFRKKPYAVDFVGNVTGFESEEEGLARHPITD